MKKLFTIFSIVALGAGLSVAGCSSKDDEPAATGGAGGETDGSGGSHSGGSHSGGMGGGLGGGDVGGLGGSIGGGGSAN